MSGPYIPMRPALVRTGLRLVAAAVVAMTVSTSARAQALQRPSLERLVVEESGKPSPTFPDFVANAARNELGLGAARQWRGGGPVGGSLTNLARLLGVYSRVHAREDVIAALHRMVALPTFRKPGVPPSEDPAILAFGRVVQIMAESFGLEFRNVDNRIFEVTLRGSGPDELGILTHCDVVPVIADEWRLPDGTPLDPFRLTRVGARLYGRGAIDDKGSIATVLYAMKAVKASGLPIARSIRLMIETTEESGGDGMRYYRERVPLPSHNIVLDSRYPAVIAEKGNGTLKVRFTLGSASADLVAITDMAASVSASTIPQTASATLAGADVRSLQSKLVAAKEDFLARSPDHDRFKIDIAAVDRAVKIKVTGISAHGSRPEEGVNPLPRLAAFLAQSGVPLAPNGFAAATRYLIELYGLDYFGGNMGLAYHDEFMGPLTMSPTMVQADGEGVEVTVNVRMPRGRSTGELVAQARHRIAEWSSARGIDATVDYHQGNWMARNPSGPWLQTLLNIFGDVTGLDSRPTSTAGGTTAKLMPNAINFGPAMPGKKYTAHNANEFKEIEDLDLDMQMVTEMLVRIGNLPEMD